MERHARPNKRSAWQDENTLRRYIPVGWNSRRLSDIARADVARLHAKIGEDHGHYAANRTLALLRTMFNLARVWELFKGENPAQASSCFAKQKRERYLNPEELAAVNRALLEEPDWRWRAYFPLALMLGTRKSELLAMRWADIDMERRTWRIPETKAGNSHLLPLPGPAVAMLSGLPSRGKSDWVFPGDGAAGHIVEPAKAWQRVRARANVADVRIHDLRHTLASWLVAQGFNLPLIGRALNHTQTATTARYAHLALDPVRAALEQTAALMVAAPEVPRPLDGVGAENPIIAPDPLRRCWLLASATDRAVPSRRARLSYRTTRAASARTRGAVFPPYGALRASSCKMLTGIV